jgi:hypothetical protein
MRPLFCCDMAAVAPATADDVIDDCRELKADKCAKLGKGRERCLATWLSLLNIKKTVRGKEAREMGSASKIRNTWEGPFHLPRFGELAPHPRR